MADKEAHRFPFTGVASKPIVINRRKACGRVQSFAAAHSSNVANSDACRRGPTKLASARRLLPTAVFWDDLN
jgi:hypothetical protein